MSETVSDFLPHRLDEWGIRRIDGYPGNGINGIIVATGRAADRIEYMQVRQEEAAAFMACAHSGVGGSNNVSPITSGTGVSQTSRLVGLAWQRLKNGGPQSSVPRASPEGIH